MLRPVRFLPLLLLLTLWVPPGGAQPLVVRHAQVESATGYANNYFFELLELALRKDGRPYRLVSSPMDLYQGRALRRLQKGQGLDVVWTMTSAQREALPGVRPIRIPLDQGLIGYRLLLVNAADTARFCAIEDAAALKALVAGQQHDWPDTAILRANGFPVETAAYAALFRMLQQHRFDYFPRSVIEVWEEAQAHADRGFVVDRCLLLRYPAAIYFFVREDNDELARRLERGLRRALEDGSFRALFLRYYGAVLARARLPERRRFDLQNPLLPPGTRIEPLLVLDR